MPIHCPKRRTYLHTTIIIMTILSALGMISSVRRDIAHRTVFFVRASSSAATAAFHTPSLSGRSTGLSSTSTTTTTTTNQVRRGHRGPSLAYATTTSALRQQFDFTLCAAASSSSSSQRADPLFSSSSSSSTSRAMSTAASETETDYELESALEDILGEALREAENPIVDAEVGGRGHIEGSRAFPKELVEEVRSIYSMQISTLTLCISL